MDKFKNSEKREGLFFLHHELTKYKWYSNLLPVFAAVLQTALSAVFMILPKLVLDAVQTNINFYDFMKAMTFACVIFSALTLANMYFHNQVAKISQTFLYRRLIPLWEKKMLSMKFEAFASEDGKIKIEKARGHITSPNWSIVELLSHETAMLEAVLGLLLYSFVVGRLHILMLLFLGALFLAELFTGLWIEKKKSRAIKRKRQKPIAK